MKDKNDLLRQLPAVERLLHAPALEALSEQIPRLLLTEAAQEAVANLRRQVLAGASPDLSINAVAAEAIHLARKKTDSSLRYVVNATGTLLHTNLGRAPLCDSALEAIERVSRGYSNLEFDLETGKRGERFSHLEKLLCRLTGAEAATVVNNNAGAVLLGLAALAEGREAVVSRGELVEIGGAFRVPDVMAAGGVRLREVGTTNKTHLSDYRNAIGEETALLLKVHTSNYRIVGFTADVTAAELVNLAREHDLPVMEDLGSGLFIDPGEFGLPREPTVREAVAAGTDVVTFSGDKLLGGPQAGLIVGRRQAIERIRKHPLARALRSDKLTLAALEATLRLYLDRDRALREIPLLRMLAIPPSDLKRRSGRLAAKLRRSLAETAKVSIVPESSAIGGGAMPLAELPGYAVAVEPITISAEKLAAALRQTDPPVVGRIQEDRLLLNPRTLSRSDEASLLAALSRVLGQGAE